MDTVRASQLAFVPAQVHKLALDGTDQFRFSRLHGIFYRASQCSLAGFKLASINDLYKLPHAPLRLDLLYCIWLCEGCLSHSRLSLTVPSLSAAGTGYQLGIDSLVPSARWMSKRGHLPCAIRRCVAPLSVRIGCGPRFLAALAQGLVPQKSTGHVQLCIEI